MTTPGGSAPDDSFVLGSTYGSDLTESSAKAIMKSPVTGSYANAQTMFHGAIENFIDSGGAEYIADAITMGAFTLLAQQVARIPIVGGALADVAMQVGQAIADVDIVAQDAQSTADTAQSTADTADMNASNAVSTANAALAAVPSLSALSKAFSGDVDATFDRILLPSNSSSSHSHTITGRTAFAGFSENHDHGSGSLATASASVGSGVPDYKPAGNGANLTEIGFVRCSRDRTYTKMTFITGDSWTALGVTAFYLGVYALNTSTGAITLVSSTGDIKSSVSSRNTEYTFTLGTPITATKDSVYGCATLQRTSAVQTCNSLCRLQFWPINAPGGIFPTTLYAYAPGSTTLPASVANGSLTKNDSFVPYYGLS